MYKGFFPIKILRISSQDASKHVSRSCYRSFANLPFSSDRDPAEADKVPIFKYVGKKHKRKPMVFVCGMSLSGALGLPDLPSMKKARWNPSLAAVSYPYRLGLGEMPVSTVACGYGFTVIGGKTTDLIKVWGTGINTDSQLGFHRSWMKPPDEDPDASGHYDYVMEMSPIPIAFKNYAKTQVLQVSCGRAHTLILTDREGIYSFGNNSFGQCGRQIIEGEIYKGSRKIHRIPHGFFSSPVTQVKCGMDHSLFLTEEGQVYACGWGADGQTGLGTYEKTGEPTLLKGDLEGVKVKEISTYGDLCLAVSHDGDLFGWGNSEYFQLSSVTDKTQVCIPTRLPFADVGKVKSSAAGGSICALLNKEGEVFVWGYGILGKGPKLKDSKYPQKIPMPLFGQSVFTPDVKVEKVRCGLNHFAAVTSRHELFMWGKNTYGCLGLGEDRNQYFPWKILTSGEVKDVECGVDHTVIISKSYL